MLQFCDPLTVLRVRLASGNGLDVLGVGQHDLKMLFENIPHRLPTNTRGFHRHVPNVKLLQPRGQVSKLAGRAPETANVLNRSDWWGPMISTMSRELNVGVRGPPLYLELGLMTRCIMADNHARTT